jgi:hypothetical protein
VPRRTQQEITPSYPFAMAAGVFSGRHMRIEGECFITHADKCRTWRHFGGEQGGRILLRSHPRGRSLERLRRLLGNNPSSQISVLATRNPTVPLR